VGAERDKDVVYNSIQCCLKSHFQCLWEQNLIKMLFYNRIFSACGSRIWRARRAREAERRAAPARVARCSDASTQTLLRRFRLRQARQNAAKTPPPRSDRTRTLAPSAPPQFRPPRSPATRVKNKPNSKHQTSNQTHTKHQNQTSNSNQTSNIKHQTSNQTKITSHHILFSLAICCWAAPQAV
jgi:hypothetical protein